MRVAVTSPYFDFFPELKEELRARFGEVKFPAHRRKMSEDELIDFLKGYDAAVISINPYTERVCASLPDRKIRSLCYAGTDHIDPAILKRHGIKMWWMAGVNKHSVAELTVCYMIMAIRRVHEFSSKLRAGKWSGPVGFGRDLRGQTVGVHGCGHIGKEVVKLLQPFGVKILACDRLDQSEFYKEWNVEAVSAQEIWARSDIVTIHLPKNSSTTRLYDDAALDAMKPGAVLINCARGGIVDEGALSERLLSGRIGGAAFDVFAMEPANGNLLLDIPNFFGSPHIGATTRESWEAMLRSGSEGLERAYEAEPGVYPFD